MSAATRRRICAVGFALGCLSLLLLGLPERIGDASTHVPGWVKMAVAFSIMGTLSATVLLCWAALSARMLEWTRTTIARIESGHA